MIVRPVMGVCTKNEPPVVVDELPVAGMLRPLPDQYCATSGLTVPENALASKAGALARALASTFSVKAPVAMLLPMLLPELLPAEVVGVPAAIVELAAGVPLVAVEEPAAEVLLPAGVLLAVEVLLPAAEPPVAGTLEATETVKACQGTSTILLMPLALLPEVLVPEPACGVCVVFIEPVLLEAGVWVVEALLLPEDEDLLEDAPEVRLTTT